MLRSISKQSGNPWNHPGKEKEGYGGKDLQIMKVLSLEWKSDGVMDDESSESMEPMEKSATHRTRWVGIEEISAWLMETSWK